MNKAGGFSVGLGGALIAALSVPVLAFASPAGAAGYPPPTLPAECSSTSTTLVVTQTGPVQSTINAPETFKPGTPVTIVFNGNDVDTVTAPPDGVITITFEAQQTAGNPTISIDGSPYQAASYGTNTVDANGVDSTGGTDGTQSCPFLVTLDPGGTIPTTTTTTGAGSTTTTTSTGSTTTTGISTSPTTVGSAGGGSTGGSTGGSSTGSSSGGTSSSPAASAPLAFTGADLLALVIGGLVLLALGTLVVLYARRRAAALAS
jgi:hypothetical protein